MRIITTALAALVLTAAACTDAGTPAGPELTARFDCEETEYSLQECSDGGPALCDGCSPYSSSAYFGVADSSLYEPLYDPSPGQPGVWLGTVDPGGCFGATSGDTDYDGLDDSCEFVIARAFAPLLAYEDEEACPAGEPYWAAKYFPANGRVRVAYMMAYYDDCGYKNISFASRADAHQGDSEMVTVEVEFNASTRHWEFRRMWLSAHYGASSGDASGWYAYPAFPRRSGTFPKVYVARDKHAHYTTVERCENTTVYVVGENILEHCDDNGRKVRVPVLEHRNAGSRNRDLVGCVYSENRTTSRCETFFTYRADNTFQGWNVLQEGKPPTSYHEMLTAGNHFDNY